MVVRRLLFFGLVCFSLLSSVLSAQDCRSLYEKLPVSEDPLSPVLGTQVSSGDKETVYQLGRGIYGTVFRVLPKDKKQSTYIRKVYDSVSFRDGDHALMVQMGKTEKGLPPQGFRVPKTEPEGSHTLRIEDTPGRDLHSVLLDPGVDAGTRERLLIQYTEKLEQFRLLLEKGPQIELKAVASRSIYYKDRKLDGTPVLSG